MPDYSDDSDEELGAYIYRTSHTAKLLREKAAAARNNELATNNTRSKRKSPHEVEENTSVLSEPKHRVKRKRKIYICINEGCTNQIVKGGVCWKHGARKKTCKNTCKHNGCNKYVQKKGVCIRHGATLTRYICSYEGCTNISVLRGVCMRHGTKQKKKTCSGAKRNICSFEGCTSLARKEGVCLWHGKEWRSLCKARGQGKGLRP